MEDIIEKIKEYKLFLALTAIGLFTWWVFFFPSTSVKCIHHTGSLSVF